MKESKIRYISIVLSILAFAGSCATIVAVYCNQTQVGFDSSAFYGCIITVLSMLVAILIGFQIINYLSFEDRIKKEVEKTISIMDKIVDNKIKDYDNKMGMIFTHQKANSISIKEPQKAISYYIKALDYAIKAEINQTDILNDLKNNLAAVELKGLHEKFSDNALSSFNQILSKCDDKEIFNRIRNMEVKKKQTSESPT